MNLGTNSLDDEGTEFIATALKESSTSKLQKLEMSSNGIGPKGAAALVAYAASLTSLSFENNSIGGYYDEDNNKIVFTPEGPRAIADALCNASLTEARCLRCAPLKLLPSQPHLSAQVNLRGNNFGEVGWCTFFDTLRDNPQNKISKWDIPYEGINPTIVKSLADYAAVSASLTSVSLAGNNLCGVRMGEQGMYDATGIEALAGALKVNVSLTSLELSFNNIKGSGKALGDALTTNSSLKELIMYHCSLDAEDGKGLAGGLAVHASLTSLFLSQNNFEGSGEALGEALKTNSSLKQLTMNRCSLNADDGKGLAGGLAVHASLTEVYQLCPPHAQNLQM